MTPGVPDAPAPVDGQADASVPQTLEQSLTPVLEGLPEPKKKEIVQVVHQQFTAVVRAGMSGPQIDPETAKILADTIQRDNDNKFRYLSQKQSDTAARETRGHELAKARHRDLMRPIVWAVVAITVISIMAGLWFINSGHETIGSSLLTGIFGALLGYLGGLGTSGHIRDT